MRCLSFLAACVTLGPAIAQDVGSRPKEINAQGFLNTEAVTIKGAEGKVVIVEFWATWCGPCKRAIPHLIEMRNRISRDKLEIVGLSDEPKSTVEPFVSQMGMNYTVGYGSSSGKDYGVRGIPHAVVIGPDGLVKWAGNPLDKRFDEIVNQLVETVKPKAAGGGESGDPGSRPSPFGKEESATPKLYKLEEALEIGRDKGQVVLLVVKTDKVEENEKLTKVLYGKALQSNLEKFLVVEHPFGKEDELCTKLKLAAECKLIALNPHKKRIEEAKLASYDKKPSVDGLKAFLKEWVKAAEKE